MLTTSIAFFVGLVIGSILTYLKMNFQIKNSIFEKKVLEEKLIFFQECEERVKGITAGIIEKYQETTSKQIDLKENTINNTLVPLKEMCIKLDSELSFIKTSLEKKNASDMGGLREQMNFLLEAQKNLHSETGKLINVLKTPGSRGRWGEIQLKRVVEMAGMLNRCDFFEQYSLNVEDKIYRPDMIVKLPGGKSIVIDSKAPLIDAYFEAHEQDCEIEKEKSLKKYAAKVKDRIKELGKKSYWDKLQDTPEFVILFLPGENFFSEALRYDPTLLEEGVDRNVILAAPTSFLVLLRTVSYGWQQENLSSKIKEVGEWGKNLYKRIKTMNDHWIRVGKSLDSSVKAYNDTIGSLESRVLSAARKFVDFDLTGSSDQIDNSVSLQTATRALVIDNENWDIADSNS